MRDGKVDYHHVIPKALYDKFSPDVHAELNKLQISLDRNDHNMVEAVNAPLVYLLVNGIPETAEAFRVFMSYSSKYLSPYNDRLRGNELCRILCSCGVETVINPRSRDTKYCRNCGTPIYNIPKEEHVIAVS